MESYSEPLVYGNFLSYQKKYIANGSFNQLRILSFKSNNTVKI